jgi:hypothetical protein
VKRFPASLHLIPALIFALILSAGTTLRAQTAPATTAPAAPSPGGQAPARSGTLRGAVTDPSGAVIPNASVVATDATGKTYSTTSDSGGSYVIRGLPPSTYSLKASAPGFAPFSSNAVMVAPGSALRLDIAMPIQVEQQQIQVQAESATVDTSPDSNANAVVIKGKDLDALSDDPDELSSELQALAGPAAGPNGGEIYIDGFTGGQLPPKSSIREIRINQNPFSAEYDRLGYGRIEILTKPGTDKLHGHVSARGNDSSFNAQNPLLNANLLPGQTAANVTEPPYYQYNIDGNIGGAISKTASYFLSVFARNNQNVSIIQAINPASVTPTTPAGQTLNTTFGNPSTRIDIAPRIDLQLGESNTLTIRYDFYRAVQSGEGVGETSLPEQAYGTHNIENTIQASDSLVLSKNLVDDIRFQYRRIRNQQAAVSTVPSVSVQGAFSDGGSNNGTVQDHQDDYELQNYFSGVEGKHSLNFGTRLRAYRDANYSNAGTNGSYTFQSLTDYLNKTPQNYTQTVVNTYTARATIFDAALFYQDDWKVNQRFTFSYGVRWEAQNRINDKNDWGPRVSFAYALDGGGKTPPKTVLRGGYGWFYQRFSVPNSFGSSAGTPYIIQAIHQNGVNQQTFIVTNPPYSETSPGNPLPPPTLGDTTKAPTIYTVDRHFKAATDMSAAIGIDRQIAKNVTANVTYLYGRGVHMYLTNNIGANSFPADNYLSNTYPDSALPPPTFNDLQYQSGGVYRQHQIIASGSARLKRVSFFSFYQYNNAHADTSGVGYVPTVAQYPGLDYGRASFDVHNRFVILGNYIAPWGLSFAPFLAVNSGTPFNITTGTDLTSNNQFNARPTYASSCTEAGVVQTPYGCLNTNPFGTKEKIIPYNFGTGPSNVSLNMRASKVIGFGPKVERGPGGGGPGGGRGGGGFRGLSGNQGGPGRLDAAVPRKYNLTLGVFAQNVFNHTNLGTPNGTIGLSQANGDTCPNAAQNNGECPQNFFLKSQSLAGGFFGPSSAGNRSVYLSAEFNF